MSETGEELIKKAKIRARVVNYRGPFISLAFFERLLQGKLVIDPSLYVVVSKEKLQEMGKLGRIFTLTFEGGN